MKDFLKELFSGQHYDENNFILIAGPCVVESEELVLDVAKKISGICSRLRVPYIFKASYRKANRTSAGSFAGLGDETALKILHLVKEQFSLPLITDIHAHEEAELAAKYVDVLQIPAFLCRQTDLLVTAARTGKIINVKKGQFVSGESMKFAVEKIQKSSSNQPKVMLTERGNSFGYTDLIVDYRNIPIMRNHGVPVIMDCTHSLQQPNQSSGVTGGNPQMIETIAKAAIATGADGLFIETHPEPAKALSDGANMLKLDLLEGLLKKLIAIRKSIL
jgi:2-dehydro-3-deoxyphosphooctonate aldolase (KDO 8-P synthase)